MADGYCNYCLNRGFCENACADYNSYLADMGKLRLYEQTGLTPTDVAEMAQPELIAGLDKLAEYESSGLQPDECRALGDAKAEGRIDIHPCNEGDAVYILRYAQGHYAEEARWTIQVGRYLKPLLSDFGKAIFPTREEAEAALAGKNENGGNET